MKGKIRGRQEKRWEANIKEWTGIQWTLLAQLGQLKKDKVERDCCCHLQCPITLHGYRIEQNRNHRFSELQKERQTYGMTEAMPNFVSQGRQITNVAYGQPSSVISFSHNNLWRI